MEAPSRRREKAHPPQKLERKTVEKKRRALMKSLFSKLDSLLPPSKRGAVGQSDRLDDACSYIRETRERLAKMEERREAMVNANAGCGTPTAGGTASGPAALPHLEVRDLGSGVEVVLVSRRADQPVFFEILRVMEEEGAEVVNAGFAVAGGAAFHSFHSLNGSSHGDPLRVAERLKEVVRELAGGA
ncbi:unnamed protein product [Spirodela intermedia]|uniref:BHLH domain-containing protein n=1 Tax=Spirodela intermedia TaxID=51605 RepID=A0A7I8LEZ5_SPIIN|nr:unnamed protein product [Spirodela intermedia]